MVGLRWWSEVHQDGSMVWKFEAQEEGHQSTTLDAGVFWVGLFVPAFDWFLLILTALALSGANIIGYVRCKKDARTRITSGLQGVVARTGMGKVMGSAIQSAAGSAFGFQ